jgi:hypothetical protein
MQYTINQLRQEIFGKVYEVYDVFQNFFGEQFTDLQEVPEDDLIISSLSNWNVHPGDAEGTWLLNGRQLTSVKQQWGTLKPVIMVWWPEVTITNENDKSITIQDLYAKIQITLEGRIPYEVRSFMLCRTTFSEVQYISGYQHSHLPSFRGIPGFEDPCLGTGPINNTVLELKNNCDSTEWMLFCQELSMYVTVESLRGGPYIRMETIGSKRQSSDYTDFKLTSRSIREVIGSYWIPQDKREYFNGIYSDFIPYYLEHGHLALNYKDGAFMVGMTYFDFIIDISNVFIDYYNRHGNREYIPNLESWHILNKVLAANNRFYSPDFFEEHDFSLFEGSSMFTFKGEMKHLHITHDSHHHVEVTLLMDPNVAMCILSNILKVINYRYRNEHSTKLGGSASTTYKTVYYL